MSHTKTLLFAAVALFFSMALCGQARADRENPRDLAAVMKAKTSLSQAVESVEKTGAHPFRAELRWKNDKPVYLVFCMEKGKTIRTSVDPDTGVVLATNQKGFLGRLLGDDESEHAAGIDSAKISLAQAVNLAEQQVGGKAYEAVFENKHGKMHFEIAVAKDKTPHEIIIDAATGQVVKTASGKETERDD